MVYKWQLRQRKSCLTQEELVRAYEGPEFDLADRYGEVRVTLLPPFPPSLLPSGLFLLPCPRAFIASPATCLFVHPDHAGLEAKHATAHTFLQRHTLRAL